MLWLRCGFKPIINKLSKQYLSFYYNVEISNHDGYDILEYMDISNIKEISSLLE